MNVKQIKQIPNMPKYYASTNGEIFGPRCGIQKPLKQSLTKDGYKKISFSKVKHGKKKTLNFRVHRLIAKTFIVNPENKPEVNHIDGIKANNNIENLEWCTKSENEKHAYAIGLRKKVYGNNHWLYNKFLGEKNHKSILREIDVMRIKKIYKRIKNKKGLRIKLANKFNTTTHNIKDICLQRTWRHIHV